MKTHTGERPYQCVTFGKSFSLASNLNRHASIDTGKRPCNCLTWGKSFSLASNFERHVSTQTEERSYNCATCDKSFPRSDALKLRLQRSTREHLFTGCPKINETHNVANKCVNFNPIVAIFQI